MALKVKDFYGSPVSLINNKNMKYGKKICKIEGKSDMINRISFRLSSVIHYSGGDRSLSIYCSKSYPFNEWKVGDCLEIDLDRIHFSNIRSCDTIYDTSIVRILDRNMVDKINKSQIELYELKNAKGKLIPMLNNFSQKIISEDFFFRLLDDDEFVFDETASPAWKVRLDDMTKKFEELKDAEKERNKLRIEFNNKNWENEDNKDKLEQEKRERQNDKTRYNNDKLEWTVKEGQKNAEIAGLKGQVESLKEELKKVVKLEDKLEARNREIRELTGKLERLQLNNENLWERTEKSQRKLSNERLNSEEDNLGLFAAELGIDLEQIHSLSKYYERLFYARKKRNQANIETHESNIAKAKQDLSQKNKISIVNILEICRKCQRMAELSWELEQTQERQDQVSEWKKINSNFTSGLIQEWVNHGFTIEQCRDWINISPPSQQSLAIKEPSYYAWLRDIKKVNPEWVLNEGDSQQLGLEFLQWYQGQQQQIQNQIEQPTK